MPTTGEEETDMYPKRSSSKPVLVTAFVMAAVVAALAAVNMIVRKPKKPAETEVRKHSVLIYKSSDGSMEGYTVREIASMENTTQSAVKNRLLRARKTLKTLLGDQLEDEE